MMGLMGRLTRLVLFFAVFIIILLGLFGFSILPSEAAAPAAAPVAPPNNCVGIASDSNGFGHVTFQIPPAPDGQVGIIYIKPFKVILRQQLDALGLNYLTVNDHSMVATSLTASERTNYLKSNFYGDLIRDRCKYIVVGPFIPDVAANQATPDNYVTQLIPLIGGMLRDNPQTTIFVLTHYQTSRADFTANNNGFGMRPERIDAFIAAVKDYCKPGRPLGSIPQVVCVDTQSLFEGMGISYLLQGANRDQFKAVVYGNTGFRPTVEKFFDDNPNARLIGDGIHLSLAGRLRLMQRIADYISQREDF